MLEAKDALKVAAFAVRIGQSIAEAFEIDGVNLKVNASICIARYPEDVDSAQELLKNADVAMYAAKQRSRARSSTASSHRYT